MKQCGLTRVSSLLISPLIEDALHVPFARRKVRLSMQAGAASAARACFPQVVLKVARIPVGNLNFGRSSGRACVCAGVCGGCVLAQGGSVSYAQEWAVGANITGVWLPRDHHRRRSFPPFPVLFASARASGIICGAGIGRAYLRPLVPLDRPKSHEISMRNPY